MTIKTTSSEKTVQSPAPHLANTPSKKMFAIILGGFFLALVYAIASIFYWKAWTTTQTLTFNHALQTLTQKQTQSADHIQSLRQEQETLQEQLNNQERSLNTVIQQHSYQNYQWLILKARYFLELAQMNAYWGNNLEATDFMLQHADKLLMDIPNQRLAGVRQAIAKERAQIQATPKIDHTAILGQLNAAQTTALALLHPALSEKNSLNENQALHTWSSSWKDGVKWLGSLIVIRHHPKTTMLLNVEQATLVREEIQVSLQEAQWAVLQDNETVYQFALKQALQHAHRLLELNFTNTQELIKQLENLQVIHLAHSKPFPDKSLPLLNQVIELMGPNTKLSLKYE